MNSPQILNRTQIITSDEKIYNSATI